jgi:preprotein translocase subunit SecE
MTRQIFEEPGSMSMSTENNTRRRRRGVVTPAVDTTADTDETTEELLEEEADETDVQAVNAYTAPKGRPTAGRRNRVRIPEEEQGNVITRRSNSVMDYVQGVRDELAKVTWPTREEVVRLGRIVVLVTVVMAIVLGAISFGFTLLFRVGLDNPILFLIFFVVVGVIGFLLTRYMRSEGSEPNYTSRL